MSNRGIKRPWKDTPYTSHKTSKRHKLLCPRPEKMRDVTWDISSTKTITQYIRKNISKLDEDIKKKTTVGLFGKTGAGKSSLINAVLGESNLLPSGTICACTSVIIQVQANVTDSNYIAEIEFISKQNWEDELETLLKVLCEDDDKDHEMFSTANDKITALYGEEGVFMTKEDLMKDERFLEIPEFLTSKIKTITCTNASDLSDIITTYVQHNDSGGCYWPVVKSVTIKIPNCTNFLEHVVLVDLPGTGDSNNSRDQMWRSKLRDCSTVWIVSEINRAGSDKEAWNILSSSVRDMAEGGECSRISFICTKTDDINPQSYMRSAQLRDEDFHITSEDPQYTSKRKNACIKHRNRTAKAKLRKIFNQQDTIKQHFNCGDNFFSVFTVSSEEFTKEHPLLKPEDTEIPKLQNLLRAYNNTHTTETANLYISGALGILSLIQGLKGNDTHMPASPASPAFSTSSNPGTSDTAPSHAGTSHTRPSPSTPSANACGCSAELIALDKERLRLEREHLRLKRKDLQLKREDLQLKREHLRLKREHLQLKQEQVQQRERHHQEVVWLKRLNKPSCLNNQHWQKHSSTALQFQCQFYCPQDKPPAKETQLIFLN